MTRWRIKVEHQGSVAKVRGWRASELIADAGLKPFFAGGGWMVDEHRLPDLLAYLDRRGIAVEVAGDTDVSPAPQTPAPESDGEADEGADVPLRGPGGDAA